MKVFNLDVYTKTLKNGMSVNVIHKPNFKQSFFLLGTSAGGMDIEQTIGQKRIVHPSGCAHFLEHQMFRLHGKDVTDDFAKYSCNVNAFTSVTETAYYFSTSSGIEKPLKLLCDFVQNLDIDEQTVEKEKGIILSEYDMYRQSPESRLMKMVWDALYHTHPIHIDVLGSREDIQNMTVEELTRFYQMNYDPKKLTLVAVSAEDPDTIFDLIESIEQEYPSKMKELPERVIKKEPRSVVSTCVKDRMDISIPYVGYAFKLEPVNDPKVCLLKEYYLQMYLDAFFTSLDDEYQSWIDQRILNSVVGAECEFSPDHAYLLFYAQTSKVEPFFEIVEKTVHKMQNQRIPEAVFTSLTHRLYASMIRTYDLFESLAVENFQAKVQGIDYFSMIDTIRKLDQEQAHTCVLSLDLSHSSKIIIESVNQG
ncbi:pitrilysin family protein [uncultured Faecalicoccus sp.]|uniref:EF-P 5-aminopentanol modification-associated protein YfmH n=1 Tax=uncultured Faecalicoccus sp. TaxID=1971760 RepID=UPI002627D946|nr:pitrilysin family protein [uncultured Faecalicoccus sp.]